MNVPAWMKSTTLLAVVFVGGAAAGIGFERRRMPAHDATRMGSHHIVEQLADQVGLDSAQRVQVAMILSRHQGTVDSTWHRIRPQLHASLDSTMQEILLILTPEQAARFRKMVQGMHPGTLR